MESSFSIGALAKTLAQQRSPTFPRSTIAQYPFITPSSSIIDILSRTVDSDLFIAWAMSLYVILPSCCNKHNIFLFISSIRTVSYTHLRAHETDSYLVCRLLLEKKKKNKKS